ncbi:HK97-gp10 family putative phage morphogenesis protein [Sphingosinithalassobacter portus]|uniref:HK97-gp10 family putative phage morphogenesis protein n=1 Tax=Stakelama portus TaxID=2676234 RepID=UPI000D6E1E05|nr:HK97-gp10 family putative phage morphogenesis protein [Sphingosinithalassobacter portus]
MAWSRGASDVRAYMARLPQEIETKLLRGAGRAAAKVVADEAKERTLSSEIRAAIKVSTRSKDGRIIAKVQVKGDGAYLAPWEEYGTSPHFITVDDSQRQGRSVQRINRLAKEKGSSHSLVIGGAFVGTTVLHPGARPHPFLRPALDVKQAEAIAAAQQYINARVTRAGIIGNAEPEGDSE